MLSLRRTKVEGGIIGQQVESFVGLENYRDVLSDPEFVDSLVRLAIYGGIVVPVMLGLALLFALLLDSPVVRLARFSRIAIFLPYAVPGVIASLMWGFMYLPDLSPMADARRGARPAGARLLHRALDLPVGGQHRDLGRRRLQHAGHLHGAAVGAARPL